MNKKILILSTNQTRIKSLVDALSSQGFSQNTTLSEQQDVMDWVEFNSQDVVLIDKSTCTDLDVFIAELKALNEKKSAIYLSFSNEEDAGNILAQLTDAFALPGKEIPAVEIIEKETVLIVDDEATNIELAANLLKSSYKVKAATSGEKALYIASKDPNISLILLDIMMPEMDGYQVCHTLKENEATKHIPIIFLTAKNEIRDVTRGFSLGAVDYITKPIQPEVLLARVETHVALMQQRKKLSQQVDDLEEIARLREDIEHLTRHDLKGPLAVILWEAAKLSDKRSSDAISLSVNNVLDMINNSLDVYKIEQNTYPLNPVNFDLSAVLENGVKAISMLAERKGISIDTSAIEKPSMVWAEEMLTNSVINNLLKNAVEASPDGKILSIETTRDGDMASVIITNYGAIPENLRQTLFDKFATSNHIKGSGLGTYSAKLMTETQGGDIRFEILNEERTRFIIRLPF